MEIQDVYVTSFEKIGYTKPKGGSGTGYCEYTKVKINHSNGAYSQVDIPTFYNDRLSQILVLKTHFSSLWDRGLYVIYNDDLVHKFFKCLEKKQTNYEFYTTMLH